MSEHFNERFECGHVANQCRCPGPKAERTVPGKCAACATTPDTPAPSLAPGRPLLTVLLQSGREEAAAAIARLEAWRKAKPGRWYNISSPVEGAHAVLSADYEVALNEECRDWKEWHSVAPTLGDAASAAIIAARKEGA